MPKMTAALTKVQNTTFAVVMVKNHVLDNPSESNDAIRAASGLLGCPLIVLMGESNRKLRGSRQDVVNFVAKIDTARLPWKTWTY